MTNQANPAETKTFPTARAAKVAMNKATKAYDKAIHAYNALRYATICAGVPEQWPQALLDAETHRNNCRIAAENVYLNATSQGFRVTR